MIPEKAVMISVIFLIPQFPQNTGQLVFVGEEGMKQKSDTVVTTVIW